MKQLVTALGLALVLAFLTGGATASASTAAPAAKGGYVAEANALCTAEHGKLPAPPDSTGGLAASLRQLRAAVTFSRGYQVVVTDLSARLARLTPPAAGRPAAAQVRRALDEIAVAFGVFAREGDAMATTLRGEPSSTFLAAYQAQLAQRTAIAAAQQRLQAASARGKAAERQLGLSCGFFG